MKKIRMVEFSILQIMGSFVVGSAAMTSFILGFVTVGLLFIVLLMLGLFISDFFSLENRG